MIDIDRYMDFLVDNRINQQQFIFMYLIHLERVDLIRKYKARFPTESNNMISGRNLADLKERGYIIVHGTNSNEIELTNKFSKIFMDDYECGNELWGEYPFYITSNGRRYPLKGMDKNVFRNLYAKKIRHSLEEHKEVMKDLQFAKENDLIFTGIEKFLNGEQWSDIRKIRKGEISADAYRTSITMEDF